MSIDVSARVRDAVAEDLPAVVALYADDTQGQVRERPGLPLADAYTRAFEQLSSDPRHRLVVLEDDGVVVATLQLSFIPHLVRLGGERAQVEAVRVSGTHRGGGLGRALLVWAVDQARERGCVLIQLTTDVERTGAQRLYQSLGFEPTHIGMKLHLGPAQPS